MPFLGLTNTRLGLWSVLPKGTSMENPEDPEWLKSRTPGLRVKHLTTKPCRTLGKEFKGGPSDLGTKILQKH